MSVILLLLYLLLMLLNLLDGISTWYFVRPDHYAREANPVARWMFRRLGITLGIMVAEALWMGTLTLLYVYVLQDNIIAGTILLALGVCVWAYIVPGNIRFCRKLWRKRKKEDSNTRD